ncbi:MAG: spore cortex biosynthesis protein YabQ [Agathobacter sp.]|nr:spore cortex biosynthesis protein YabQ [Agathobacter sp.]MBQ2283900.1 spore cortex biosynthesis protein YabQ [Agathobacter sp.]
MNGVSISILDEAGVFWDGLILGVLLVAGYDLVRVFRRLIRHGILWVSIEDCVYWIVCAVLMFAMLYQNNDGRIRAYIFGAAVLGGILYHLLLGKHFIRIISKVILAIKKQLKKAWKVVTMFLKNKFRIEVHNEDREKKENP